MKNYFIILFIIALTGCAKKTHISSTELESNFKFNSDTSSTETFLISDKTKTFTTKTIDTTVTITGSVLSGYLLAPKLVGDTSASFENEDLTVMVNVNKMGVTRFVAKQKPKKIPFKINEHTAIYKDLLSKEDVETKVKTSVEAINTMEQKHSEKQTTTHISAWHHIALFIAVVVALIWVIRKLSLLKLLW